MWSELQMSSSLSCSLPLLIGGNQIMSTTCRGPSRWIALPAGWSFPSNCGKSLIKTPIKFLLSGEQLSQKARHKVIDSGCVCTLDRCIEYIHICREHMSFAHHQRGAAIWKVNKNEAKERAKRRRWHLREGYTGLSVEIKKVCKLISLCSPLGIPLLRIP